MVVKRLPDINNAVEHFQAGFRDLKYLPFVTDAEAVRLYGTEVTAAVHELDNYNRHEQLCGQCQSHCCLRVKCEIYDVRFSGCLVESLRPSLCRLHFCEKYNPAFGPLVKILGDIYLESLLAAAKIDSATADMFDCPTFSPLAPHLMSVLNPVLDRVRSGVLTEQNGRLEIQVLIEQNSLAIAH